MIIIDSKTDVGKRSNNEDTPLALKLGEDNYLLAVADGMGGSDAGEVASATVIQELERSIRADLSMNTGDKELKPILKRAFEKAQEKVVDKINENPDLKRMGTTLVAVLVHKKKYVWGNIGDSRMYLMKKESANLLTKDHSHIQEMIDKGEALTLDYIAKNSNLITKCISSVIEEADIYPMDTEYHILEKDSALLLCSDGLITVNHEDDINQAILTIYFSGKILDQVFDDLIKYAKNEGSRDNITVAALENGDFRRKMDPTHLKESSDISQLPGSSELSGKWHPAGKKFNQALIRRKIIWLPVGVLLVLTGIIAYLILHRAIFDKSDHSDELLLPETRSTPFNWADFLEDNYIISDSDSVLKVTPFSATDTILKLILHWEKLDGDPILTTVYEEYDGRRGVINVSSIHKAEHPDSMNLYAEIVFSEDSVLKSNIAKIDIRK